MASAAMVTKIRRRSLKSSGALLSLAARGGSSETECPIPRRLPASSAALPRAPASEMRWLATLVQRDIGTALVARIQLARAADLLHRVLDHLVPLRDPADGARDGEQYCKHRDRDAHRLEDDAGIEVDVGIELALDEVRVLESDALKLHGKIEERLIADAELVEHLVAVLAQNLRARIVVLVDAMAEPHEAGVAVLFLDALQELRNAVLGADLRQHLEDGLVGTAMRRTPQRGDPGGDAGKRVGARRACHAHRRGRGVLLMVGMQDEDLVHGVRQDRVHHVFLARYREHHMQK